MRLPRFPFAFYRIAAVASIVATVACNNSSGLEGSGAKTSNPYGSGDGKGGSGNGDGDGSDGGDGHSGEGSEYGTGGRGDTDLSKTGFDKREKLPDGTVQLVKKGESTKSVLPVDIIFAIDTSGSMSQEKAALKAKIPVFLQKLDTVGTGLDYRVWILIDDPNYLSGNNPKIELINSKVDSKNALQRFSDFVKSDTPVGTLVKTKLRNESLKHFVVITDDNAGGFLASDFLKTVDETPILKGKTSMNGVIGLPTSAKGAGCTIDEVGEQYQMLAGEKPLAPQQNFPLLNKGLILDLCAADWTGQLVDGLANKVISETLKLEFPLPGEAKTASNFTVKIGGRDVLGTAYSYDATKNALIFTTTSAPKAGEEMVVRYVPKSS